MRNNIIDTFNTEKEIYEKYPKTQRFEIKDIFKQHWSSFLDYAKEQDLYIRPVVTKEVDKMLDCKTPNLGYNLWQCPTCGHEHIQHNTCKSRFCNSCGIKYSKERTLTIMSKLINSPHRHLTFTIPDILWKYFGQDRSRLNLLFEAVNITLSSWCKVLNKTENYKPGFILTIHTFGRDNKWNTHIHCLIAEALMGNHIVYKKWDFFPYQMLRLRFRKVLLDLMELNIGKSTFRNVKNDCYTKYKNGFYVRAKKNEFKGNPKKALEYILRYCGRPCFASYRILDIDSSNMTIKFWYQRHDDDLFVVEHISIFDFFKRLIMHIFDYQFKSIRYYGFYASKSHKFYNQFKLLIDKTKLPFLRSLNKWRLLLLASFKFDPLICPNCDTIMLFQRLII
jgi:hypothetical protein